MFPNESSSDEISAESSDAFVQNRKEPAEHRGVFGGVTATSFDSQRPVCPVDQVPVSRESIGDHILSGASSNPTVVVVATGNNLDKAEANCAQVLSVTPKTTHVVYSKEQVQPEVAMTEEGVTQERATRIMMHTVAAAKAAGPCDPKSEAELQVLVVKTDLASAKLSASVIFPSSRCGEVAPPSLHKGSDRTSQEAQLGFNASHLGSSSSKSLHCAQSHKPLDTQANSDPKINTSQVPLTTPQSPCNKENHLIQRYSTTKVKDEQEDYLTTQTDGPNVRRDQGTALQDKFSLSNLNIPRDRLHGPASNAGWGIPKGLGLRGGGESSLNNGTSGWGTPPASTSNAGWGQNAAAQNAAQGASQWGSAPRPGPPAGPNSQPTKGSQSPQQSTQQQQPSQQQNQQPTTASSSQQGNGGQQQQQNQPPSQQPTQAGGASGNGQGAPAPNGSPSWAQAAGGAGGSGPGKGPGQPPGPNGGGTATSKQLEQINSMREALLSQDGWGGQHVNQDTGWDIPGSPEPGMKEGGWKTNVNNGTELWEANLRNGGQPPPQPAAKTPWGHTPSTNIGGTWGEDDDTTDNTNMWQGVPNNNQSNPQWGGGGPTAMPKKDNDWSGGGGGGGGDGSGGRGGGGSTWGDSRDMRGGGGGGGGMGMDPRANERDMRGGMGMDMRGGGGGDMMRPDMMMNPRGDPRLGRMNGEAPMWGGAPKGQQPPVNQWGGPPPKDMKSHSGWEEPSPPAQRRQAGNYDDGTSLWGNPGNPQAPTWRGPTKADGNKVSHWKDIPHPSMGGRGSGMQCPPGMAQGRGMPGAGGIKPEAMWGHPQRNGSWDGPQGPHDGPGGWGDDGGSKMGWNDQNMMPQGSWGGPKPKPMGGGGWGDGTEVDPSSWGHPKPNGFQGPKPLTKDMIWASKQFRLMTEMNMGYKKDDIENALRNTNMNMEDAIELLNAMRDGYRRPDEHSFDLGGSGGPHPGGPGGSGYPGRGGYNPPQQMPFAPPGPGVNNAPSLMNNANNPSLPSINTMSPAIVQKILTQQPPPAAAAQPSTQQPFQSVQRTPLSQPQPSAAQLRMLVQQIQTAVQSGHLNPQILNQPLAPQTLQLLNQLLNQIKLQHSLVQQQTLISLQPLTKQQSQNHLQISVQITKTKQTIANLQNQIAAQQALFVKQQSMNSGGGPQADFFPKPQMNDPTMPLDVGLSHLSMKEPQSQQSRLNQWIKPDKDSDGSINEFDRAPGNSKSQSHTSPNMNPLLGQGDSTWSSVGRGAGDSGWPDASADLGAGTQNDSTNSFEVPEFEPGKPWKGNNLKNIEDDPTLTPGSVMPSALSVPVIKDSVFSSNKTSPPASIVASASDTMSSVGLSNPTWSYNSASAGSAFASLSTNGSGPRTGGGGSSWSTGGWGGSTWLLLRNLTPQIDGSTLKTLCLQHGPLQNFHLYLSHGLAMAKYQSREEAAKAQGALNNCVLGNTTIFAESPADSEVHSLMTQLQMSQSQGPNAGGWGSIRPGSGPNSSSGERGSGVSQPGAQPTKPPPDTWGGSSNSGGSQLWSAPTSASSLWGAPTMDGGDQHRTTPSSLNSFLPGDLLGEGPM